MPFQKRIKNIKQRLLPTTLNNFMCEKMYVVGGSISHSKSPQLWRDIFLRRGLDWTYEIADFASEQEAEKFILQRDFRAINITTPYKSLALKCADDVNEISKFCGGSNFLINENGHLSGYNTDGYGCVYALLDLGSDLKNTCTIVCGSGPTAKSISYALLEAGAIVIMLTRDREKVDIASYPKNFMLLEYSQAEYEIPYAKIIVNATTLGMREGDPSPVDSSLLNSGHLIFDCIYGHGENELAKAANKACAKYHDGSKMLYYQAQKCEEIFFGELYK